MKLDRNSEVGQGKYAIVNLRRVRELAKRRDMSDSLDYDEANRALTTLQALGILEYGEPNSENEFFVIKLKDQFARGALYGYVNAAMNHANFLFHKGDVAGSREFEEYSLDVADLLGRAGDNSKFCKLPD